MISLDLKAPSSIWNDVDLQKSMINLKHVVDCSFCSYILFCNKAIQNNQPVFIILATSICPSHILLLLQRLEVHVLLHFGAAAARLLDIALLHKSLQLRRAIFAGVLLLAALVHISVQLSQSGLCGFGALRCG